MKRRLLIDPHVHRYRCHNPGRWLDAASRNLGGTDPEAIHCLILTETASEDSFRTLRPGLGGWQPWPTLESCSIVLRRDGAALTVIAGQQISTTERLEVLALGCADRVEDGLSIARTLDQVQDRGAIAVLPWGVGKWSGRRGDIVAALIERCQPGDLFVSDNGNRPQPSPMPKLITRATMKGLLNLPGSDPLRLRWHQNRPGSYGFALEGDFDDQRPMASIQAMLAACRTSPQPCGRRVNWINFVLSQMALRLMRS